MALRGSGYTSAIVRNMLAALRESDGWRAVFWVKTNALVGYVRRLVAFLAPGEPGLWARIDVLAWDPERAERRLRGTRDRAWRDHHW